MATAVQPLPNGAGAKLDEILKAGIKHDVSEDPMTVWDKGVFLNELLRQGIVLTTGNDGVLSGGLATRQPLQKGTYHGTQMALNEFYNMIEDAAISHFNVKGFEPIIPTKRDLAQKRDIYDWSKPDGFPPHLNIVPPDKAEGAPGVGQIFDLNEKLYVNAIATAFNFIIPQDLAHKGTPYVGPTLADCEKYNKEHPAPKTDIMDGASFGNLPDWYSDARFAQQHLSGVNPSTIAVAPSDRVKEYMAEADRQGLQAMRKLLSENKDILIQDYSYFRQATKLPDQEQFKNLVPEDLKDPLKNFVYRYACAPIAIFQLHSDGRLHPLAITLDYVGSLDKSITLFNQRLNPDDKGKVDEKNDWPWRYAKTCVQTADWARHEIATHLVDTHMIEEAIIVATNRTVPEDHLLHEILSPHWFRTLPLNQAARLSLVPGVIARLAGFGPSIDAKGSRAYGLMNWSYENFNFQDKYIPNDLRKRGFNLEGNTGHKYRNYPYATQMYLLWGVIRDFVKCVLETQYKSDKDVQGDKFIADWCTEIQTKGMITTFPTIKTVNQLIDAVTMCIHTASAQHTAVNYLQNYYYGFVPARPPSLCTPLPVDLKTLKTYTEKDLTAALPIGTENPKWKDWLLAAQLPQLLSYRVEPNYTLITYAKSLYNVNENRPNFENPKFDYKHIQEAAAKFYDKLKRLEVIFDTISKEQTPGTVPYPVLQPEVTAISILI